MPLEPAPLLVRMLTTAGELLIEVDAGRAPAAAGGFLRYVDAGRYVGGAFARTVYPGNDQGSPPISVIQATAADVSDPLFVAHEPTSQTGLSHVDGAVSLPRQSGSGGSPVGFFVCIGDQPGLDAGTERIEDRAGFAPFGRLVEGAQVARRIHQAPTLADAPSPYMAGQFLRRPVAILSARREPRDAAARLAALADDCRAVRNAQFPVAASLAGGAGRGDLLDRVGLDEAACRAEVAAGLARRLEDIDPGGLSPRDAATHALVRRWIAGERGRHD